MQAIIAEVLRAKMGGLGWIERVGGLVQIASRPVYSTAGPGMKATQTGTEYYPVACNVNVADCWENGVYKLLEPDGKKSGVLFFMDNGGIRQIAIEGPKSAFVRFSFSLKMLCWLNLPRLGDPITANGATASGRIAPFFMGQLYGEQTATGVFNGELEEEVFKSIRVTKIDELTKTPEMFAPFDFSRRRELFFYPYDYMGFVLEGEFLINKNCLPEFGAAWEPAEGCLVWASDPGGVPGAGTSLCKRLFQCLATLDEFDTDADGIAGGLLVDGKRFFIAGANHDGRQQGQLVILDNA